MAAESSSIPETAEIFEELESYPWDKDVNFQGGLSAILGDTTSPSQIHELTLRAQCFYLSRKRSIPIDFNAYKTYLASKPASTTPEPSMSSLQVPRTPKESNEPEHSNHESDLPPAQTLAHSGQPKSAPYPSTFAEIVALITAGKPIPGIQDIPPTLLSDQATKPVVSKRRKPWEKETVVILDPGVVGGTFGDRRDELIEQEAPDE